MWSQGSPGRKNLAQRSAAGHEDESLQVKCTGDLQKHILSLGEQRNSELSSLVVMQDRGAMQSASEVQGSSERPGGTSGEGDGGQDSLGRTKICSGWRGDEQDMQTGRVLRVATQRSPLGQGLVMLHEGNCRGGMHLHLAEWLPVHRAMPRGLNSTQLRGGRQWSLLRQ